MTGFEMPAWGGMFVPDLSLAESFLRGSVVYLSLLVLFRAILKRQAGSIGLPDVMLVVLVSECVSPALAADAKSIPNGLVAVFAMLFWNYTLDRLTYHWSWLERLLEPRPLELVRDGVPVRKNLVSEGITDDELAAQLRLNGIDDVAKVKVAYIESEGAVSVIPKEDSAPTASTDSPSADLGALTRRFLSAAADLQKAVAWHEARAAATASTAPRP